MRSNNGRLRVAVFMATWERWGSSCGGRKLAGQPLKNSTHIFAQAERQPTFFAASAAAGVSH